jgi:hypothetical protein
VSPVRKPLARVEGRTTLPGSGLVVQWRGTPGADDWALFIAPESRAKRLILADNTTQRRVKALLARLRALSRSDVRRLAKG